MSVIGSNVLAGASGSAGAAGYEIERSLRFNSADSAYLNRTPSSAGNRKTWTWSGWVKLTKPSSTLRLLSAGTAATQISEIYYTSDQLRIFHYPGSISIEVVTAQVFRDFSAWHHVVVAVDTTQSTASNRVRLYVNGSEVDSFSTATYPSQNTDTFVNGANAHYISATTGDNNAPQSLYYGDGYLADVHFIDGQALAPTDFGEYDNNNVWQPKEFSGTYTSDPFYSSYATNPSSFNGSAHNLFDGDLTTGWQNTDTSGSTYASVDLTQGGASSGAAFTTSFEMYGAFSYNQILEIDHAGGTHTYTGNPGGSGAWVDFTSNLTSPVTAVRFKDSGGSGTPSWNAIRVDNTVLIETGLNSFHLDFSDNSSNAALGDDSSGNNNDWTVNNISVVTGGPTSVASASGALPIFNTTDTYGSTKGSGLRADSNASALSLCVPMGTSTGLSLTDESPTGRTSSVSTLSNTSVTNSTSNFKFYGGSASFNGTSSKLTTSATSDFLFGTGDFTFEGWFYQTSQNTYNSVLEIGNHLITSGIIFIVSNLGNATIYAGGFVGSAPITLNKWNHIAYVRESGVLRIYVDGVLGSTNNFTGDLTSTAGGVTIGTTHSIGATGYYYPGFMQDLRIYKGLAKYTSNFNPPSSTQNTTIAAGNDSLVDSPTNGTQTDTGVGGEVVGNYATLNPLITTSGPLSNGNLEMVGANAWRNTKGTISVSSGKWYFEATYSGSQFGSALGNLAAGVGFAKTSVDTPNVDVNTSSLYGSILAFNQTGHVNNFNAPSSARSQIANGDVIGLALDLDAGSYVIYVNNTSTSSGSLNFTGQLTPWVNAYYSGNYFICNFGQRAFAYTAPSGFNAINTASLSDPTIADGSTAMDVALYTGNGSTQTISGLGFSPDFVWIKNRQVARDHRLFDVVRGATQSLQSSLTAAEVTESTSLTAFTSDGFSLGSLTAVNESTKALVAWTWDAGSSTVSNTDGSITSSVRANASAGFSIVSYGNTESGSTIGHSLNATPSWIIIKNRDSASDWFVWITGFAGNEGLNLNNADGKFTSGSNTFLTAVSNSTFTVGSSALVNSSNNYIAYCFAPVEGYSAFGSYEGGSSPFVFTNFRPRWVMIKNADLDGEEWTIFDTARDTYNVAGLVLYPNTAGAEFDGSSGVNARNIDVLSNGFKINTGNPINQTGTHVYAAFGDPFKTARAR